MYELKVDREAAIIDVELGGNLRVEDVQGFTRELQEAIGSLAGREIRLKLDARTLRPFAPEVVEALRAAQALAMRSGVRRIAELVQGGVVALQLGRVAQESGADRILRRFLDERLARDWLRETEPPSTRAGTTPSGRRTLPRRVVEAPSSSPGSEAPSRRATSREAGLFDAAGGTTLREPPAELVHGGAASGPTPRAPAEPSPPTGTLRRVARAVSRTDVPAADPAPGSKPKA